MSAAYLTLPRRGLLALFRDLVAWSGAVINMALVHVTAHRNTLAAAITTAIDTGGGANGTLEFQTAASAEVATINLAAPPSFGAPAAGIATISATVDDTDATGSGSAVTKYIVKDRAGVEVYQGTVTITSGGGDIELTAVIIGAGSTVSIGTNYTYAASA